jgi:hypothetical protein
MGHDQVKRMILEFRSRVALCDLGIYSDAARKLSDQYFGTVVESEGSHKCDPWKMTPYVETYPTDQGWIIPENSTLPGWTGANVIPIKVKGDKATVSFEAVKQPAINGNYEPLDLVCQLCWRTTDGRPVYAQPFEDGDCTVSLAGQQPANGVIFAVVCNRTYRFKPVLLKTKYWYKLKLGEGTDGTASTQTKWFNYDQKLS